VALTLTQAATPVAHATTIAHANRLHERPRTSAGRLGYGRAASVSTRLRAFRHIRADRSTPTL
jgi:hypothetical protein